MTDQEIQRKAPTGKFRVIGFALSDDQIYLIGDFGTVRAAEECAKMHGTVGNPTHVYDDAGELVVRYGSRQ